MALDVLSAKQEKAKCWDHRAETEEPSDYGLNTYAPPTPYAEARIPSGMVFEGGAFGSGLV